MHTGEHRGWYLTGKSAREGVLCVKLCVLCVKLCVLCGLKKITAKTAKEGIAKVAKVLCGLKQLEMQPIALQLTIAQFQRRSRELENI